MYLIILNTDPETLDPSESERKQHLSKEQTRGKNIRTDEKIVEVHVLLNNPPMGPPTHGKERETYYANNFNIEHIKYNVSYNPIVL